jgi:hypothetical protein
MQLIVAQRLAWTVGKYFAPVTDHRVWQLKAGRFEVALQADFHLPLAGQALGIHDGRLDFGWRFVLSDCLDVRLARAVAPLAIDPFRQLCRIHRVGARDCRLRIRVVAGEAGVTYGTPKVLMRRTVITRAHRQRAAVLGIPTHRQLHQTVFRRAMEIGPRMIAGAHYVVNLGLEDVDLLAVRAFLMTAFERTGRLFGRWCSIGRTPDGSRFLRSPTPAWASRTSAPCR